MGIVNHTRIKICCIGSVEEAQLAIRSGASALGFVSAMPSGPGVIPEERIIRIVREIPPGMPTFLLTSELDAKVIIAQQRCCQVTTLQLVDQVSKENLAMLRDSLPGIMLVQVVHITGPQAVEFALDVAPSVDALLLDSGNPQAAVRELGGTGRVHDWRISRTIIQRALVPVFLAGGLRPENVGQAIREVGPYGVDVCSGVRTNGHLNEELLSKFVSEVQKADMLGQTAITPPRPPIAIS